MPENEENKKQATPSPTIDSLSSSGDPGRTPGLAEGDEETIDEDIEQKLGDKETQKD